jgi:hypothetical protein
VLQFLFQIKRGATDGLKNAERKSVRRKSCFGNGLIRRILSFIRAFLRPFPE